MADCRSIHAGAALAPVPPLTVVILRREVTAVKVGILLRSAIFLRHTLGISRLSTAYAQKL